MIAKVITHGAPRDEAAAKMKRALGEFVIKGIDTNIDFQLDLLNHERFVKGEFDTNFISRVLEV
jgi:acetyl-CoA carboxylase biotin carboxylase subunit